MSIKQVPHCSAFSRAVIRFVNIEPATIHCQYFTADYHVYSLQYAPKMTDTQLSLIPSRFLGRLWVARHDLE